MNIKKREDIKKHFKQQYTSIENSNLETNHSTQSEKSRRPENQIGFKKLNLKKESIGRKHICWKYLCNYYT